MNRKHGILLLFCILLFPSIIYHQSCHIRAIQLTETNTEDSPSLRSAFCGQMVVNVMNVIKWFDYRPDDCEKCMEVDFPVSIYPANICAKDNNIKALIIISTSLADEHLRSVIRQTWLTVKSKNTAYVFLLGTGKNRTIQERLVKESSQYKDILQNNFVDDYRNLTIKTISGLKWAVSNCPHIEYVIKTDSDILFNIPKWENLIFGSQKSRLKDVMFGYCHRFPFVNRAPFYKRAVHMKAYPRSRFPSYCHGAAYGLSLQLALKVVEISYKQRFIPVEDAYIGVCLEILGKKVYNPPNLLKYRLPELRPRIDEDPCSVIEDLYVIYDIEANELAQLWKRLSQC